MIKNFLIPKQKGPFWEVVQFAVAVCKSELNLVLILCIVYCVLCIMYCVLCIVYCVLCIVYCVLCIVYF